MQQKYVSCLSPIGFHSMAYTEWGDNKSRSILCVHGLTRNGRDFDQLAMTLSSDHRIVCPDLIGRGNSTWFGTSHLYNQAQYMADIAALMARMDVPNLIWIGTSLGGILGMHLAGLPNTPIKALVLNDIGAEIGHAGLIRIGKYGKPPQKFASLQEVEQYLRKAYKDSDNLSDELWHYTTEHNVKKQPDGSYILAYDPHIFSNPFMKFIFFDIKLWHLWEKIKCPVLVIRGGTSDILLRDTTDRMQTTGPKTEVHEVANCGHAPMLKTPDQIAIITTWLQKLGI